MPKVVRLARKKVLGFVWKHDPLQVGGGFHAFTVCFPRQRVYVSYQCNLDNGDKKIQFVESPIDCDGSCIGRHGVLEDFLNSPWDHMKGIASIATDFATP